MENTKPVKKKKILPYPHQDDRTHYPEFEIYGELWKLARPDDNTSSEYVKSYNRFREAIHSYTASREMKVREEGRLEEQLRLKNIMKKQAAQYLMGSERMQVIIDLLKEFMFSPTTPDVTTE